MAKSAFVFGLVLAVFLLVVIAFVLGSKYIVANRPKGKPYVDLLSLAAGSSGLIGSLLSVAAGFHVIDGRLASVYNIYAEPNNTLLVLAIASVAIGIGLSAAKRYDDYKLA